MAGLEATRVWGRKGRHKPVTNQKKVTLAYKLTDDQQTLISEGYEAVGVSKATFDRYLKTDGTSRNRL